jgi:hypothetical protein
MPADPRLLSALARVLKADRSHDMIDVYHCPRCSRLLKREGVVSIGGYELPVFQCDDCIVKRAVFGPGTEEFDMAYTFCVDSAGRCFDPTEDLGDEDDEELDVDP